MRKQEIMCGVSGDRGAELIIAADSSLILAFIRNRFSAWPAITFMMMAFYGIDGASCRLEIPGDYQVCYCADSPEACPANKITIGSMLFLFGNRHFLFQLLFLCFMCPLCSCTKV